MTVRNADGTSRFSVTPFGSGFTGGVRVLSADVTGDGVNDVVVVPGFGGAPVLKVLDATTGAELFSLVVFEESFRGGLFIDAAAVTGTAYSQVVLSAGPTGGPRVTVFDVSRGTVVQNFFAGDVNSRAGVTVDLAELRPGAGQQIIAALGPGAGPVVMVYNASTGHLLGQFLGGSASNRDGIKARAGELNAATNTRFVIVSPFTSTTTRDDMPVEISRFVNFTL